METIESVSTNGDQSSSGDANPIKNPVSFCFLGVCIDCSILYGEDWFDQLTEDQKDILRSMIIDLKRVDAVDFIASCLHENIPEDDEIDYTKKIVITPELINWSESFGKGESDA